MFRFTILLTCIYGCPLLDQLSALHVYRHILSSKQSQHNSVRYNNNKHPAEAQVSLAKYNNIMMWTVEVRVSSLCYHNDHDHNGAGSQVSC